MTWGLTLALGGNLGVPSRNQARDRDHDGQHDEDQAVRKDIGA